VNSVNTHELSQNDFKPQKNLKIESAFDIIFNPNYKEQKEDCLNIPHIFIEDFLYENLSFS
jgi:hypothetical protein